MNRDFNSIQKNYYQTHEEKRFYWQTQNPYVVRKELELISPIKSLIEPDDKILEVGCGEGANIIHLRESGINNSITGVDFSESKVSFCQSLNIENTSYICADARKLPFEDNSFQLVLARDLLHHVNDDRKAVIEELLRVTAPGKAVIIIEGNGEKFTNFVFATIFSHERGMKDSIKTKHENLLKDYKHELTAHEPSNFFRFVLHYSIGMPYLANFKFVCKILNLINTLFEKVLPEKKWAYWFIKIIKRK